MEYDSEKKQRLVNKYRARSNPPTATTEQSSEKKQQLVLEYHARSNQPSYPRRVPYVRRNPSAPIPDGHYEEIVYSEQYQATKARVYAERSGSAPRYSPRRAGRPHLYRVK